MPSTSRPLRRPRRRSRRSALATVLALAAAAVLALTACEPREVGAAATVGDARLTIAEVQQEVEAYAETLPDRPSVARLELGAFQSRIVQLWVQHQLFTRIAEQRDIVVTEAAVDAELAALKAQGEQAFLTQIAQQGFTPTTVRTFIQDQIVASQLGDPTQATEVLIQESEAAGVWVNPRYGQWTGAVVEPGTGSISIPVEPGGSPEPTGAPEPTPEPTPEPEPEPTSEPEPTGAPEPAAPTATVTPAPSPS